ncbi:hypothetical protein ACIPQA_16210 [Streptomyces sp. NPDC090109]|uniref:hypothetical protein n=1 Tax=Streptomyces sp. NPDC090109 TaxID=3365948 RepID=UPI003816E0EF
MPAESTTPQLSITSRSDWLAGYLRADQIRTDTLVQLVTHWTDEDAREEIIAALDQLADVVASPRQEGALDAAVEAVEDAAAMDTAHIPLDKKTAVRLLGELTVLVRRLTRFGAKNKPHIPTQQDRRWSA